MSEARDYPCVLALPFCGGISGVLVALGISCLVGWHAWLLAFPVIAMGLASIFHGAD